MLELDAPLGGAPLLSVFGGKITTYRRLAEHAMQRLAPTFPDMGAPWTQERARCPAAIAGRRLRRLALSRRTQRAMRFSTGHGRRASAAPTARASGRCSPASPAPADLGRDFGAGLTEREIDYLVANEWAETADDILWRRTKLGLRLGPDASDRGCRLCRAGRPAC